MSDDRARDALLAEVSLRTSALRDLVAVLFATQARASGNPDALFREVSAGLDTRLEALNVTEPRLLPHVERIRKEFDWVVATARTCLGQIPPSPSE
jgi:hypothetical protein